MQHIFSSFHFTSIFFILLFLLSFRSFSFAFYYLKNNLFHQPVFAQSLKQTSNLSSFFSFFSFSSLAKSFFLNFFLLHPFQAFLPSYEKCAQSLYLSLPPPNTLLIDWCKPAHATAIRPPSKTPTWAQSYKLNFVTSFQRKKEKTTGPVKSQRWHGIKEDNKIFIFSFFLNSVLKGMV